MAEIFTVIRDESWFLEDITEVENALDYFWHQHYYDEFRQNNLDKVRRSR